MAAVVHHALLGAAVAALLGAGTRVAALATPSALERAVGAVVLAAAVAVVEALALGLVGLGTSPVALGLAAAATWALARVLLPSPAPGTWQAAVRAWRGLTPAGRAALGAGAGVLVAWGVWALAHPAIGLDGVVYHLTEVVGWVHSGHPGSIQRVTYEYPVGNYPLTNEVLLAWATGIARSFVPSALSGVAALGLLAASGWMGLRALGARRVVAALAVAAVCTLPLTVQQLGGPNTDLPALAWLTAAAALCACSARRPALLAVALVAAALAVGTKTTVLPLAALALAVAAVRSRGALRGLRLPLALAAGAALVVGGTWYLRNLLTHGSPFWPFVAAPWGDPAPAFLDHYASRFATHPQATLHGRGDDYLNALAGAVVVLAGAPLAALVARARAATVGAAVALGALALWAAAPFTGVPDAGSDPVLALSAIRYLLPAIAAAVLALALAARARPAAQAAAGALLAAAVGWNLARLVDLGYPWSPPAWWILAAAGGAAGAAALTGMVRPPSRAGLRAGLLACLAGAALAPAAGGYVERHARTHATFDHRVVAWFARRPAFEAGGRPVVLAPLAIGVLAGDRIQHSVGLIDPGASCAAVRAHARRGWVVVRRLTAPPSPFVRRFLADDLRAMARARCLASRRPLYVDDQYVVYGPS